MEWKLCAAPVFAGKRGTTMENTKKGAAEWFAQKGTYIYLLVMLLVFALFYTDKMHRVVADKKLIFQVLTAAYFCALLPFIVKRARDLCKGRCRFEWRGADAVFAVILFLAIILSTVLSGEGRRIFLEQPTLRSISGLCFLACVLVYFAVRRYGVYDSFVLWAWMIGSAIIYLYGILCSCGINFMYIQEETTVRHYYLTPLGGCNENAVYVCLMQPVIMVMYMVCRERFSQIIYSVYLCMGFLFSTFIKTESSSITMVFGIILLGYFALEKQVWFERYMHLIAMYLGSKGAIRILLYLFPNKLYPFDGINLLLLDPRVILGEAAVWALVYVLQHRADDLVRRQVLGMRKYFLGAAMVGAVCFVVGVVAANTMDVSEGSFLSCLQITDSLFNARGFIWKKTAEALGKESVVKKLFGNGLGSLYGLVYTGPDREALLAYMGGIPFRDPHNTYLQILVDMGILGFVGYFGLILTTLVKALRRWKENELQVAVALTVSMYLVQAMVNAYVILHLPLLFIFLGLANGAMAVKQEDNVADSSKGAGSR